MLFTLPVFKFHSWLLGPSEVLWLKLPGCSTRILFLYYILLGHKRSLGGILPFCWVRWPCGWCLLPVTWFSWSLKDLTRIVILLPCQFFSHFVLTVHLHRLQNLSWNSIRGSKNLSPLCVLRAGVFSICFLVWWLSCCFLILGVFHTLVRQSIYTTCKIYLKTLSAA